MTEQDLEQKLSEEKFNEIKKAANMWKRDVIRIRSADKRIKDQNPPICQWESYFLGLLEYAQIKLNIYLTDDINAKIGSKTPTTSALMRIDPLETAKEMRFYTAVLRELCPEQNSAGNLSFYKGEFGKKKTNQIDILIHYLKID